MEIRDPIHGPITTSQAEMDVIAHPLFERLRGIKQLDFSEYTFPGATHTRYIHSLGTMHLAGLAFDMMARDLGQIVPASEMPRLRQTVRLAGLLHDLGHPPMSHTGERLLPDLTGRQIGNACCCGHTDHEALTRYLLLNSEIHQLIGESFADSGVVAEHVEAVLSPVDEDVDCAPFHFGGVNVLTALRQLVSGELDVDRMDYLLRDSYFTGVAYGRFEKDWLLSHIGATVEDGRAYMTLEANAVFTLEDFLLSRHHMFLMVYSHPRTQTYHRLLSRFLDATGLRLPASLLGLAGFDDSWLMDKLRKSDHPDAVRICHHDVPRLIFEAWGDEADRLAALQGPIEAALPDGVMVQDSNLAFSRYFSRGQRTSDAPALRVRQVTPGGLSRILPVEQYSDMYVRQARPRRSVRIFGDTGLISQVETVIRDLAHLG